LLHPGDLDLLVDLDVLGEALLDLAQSLRG
jgi:hypothetical protein